ncbi:hypothetical protein QYF36_012762 [Acer negundo]|nr:hypothetical protein QYF36_012762 [Acer negundo]
MQLAFPVWKKFREATRIVDQRGFKRISGEPSEQSIFQVNNGSRTAFGAGGITENIPKPSVLSGAADDF